LDTNLDSVIYYASLNLNKPLASESDFYSYFLIAFSYKKQKEYRKSFNANIKGISLIPEGDKYEIYRFKMFYNMGKIAGISSNYDLSISLFNKAIPYVTDDWRQSLMMNLGNAYRKKGDFKNATDAYMECLELAFQNNNSLNQAKSYHQLGLVYNSLGDYEEARSKFLTITRRDIRSMLVGLYIIQGTAT